MRLIKTTVCLLALAAGCSDNQGNTPSPQPDPTPDVGAGDVDPPDAPPEPDAGEPDAEPDATPEPEPCPPPPEGEPPPLGRWSLSMFHYNIQYVAGGTEGFAEIALNAPAAASQLDLSAEDVEDRIVTQSLDPVLGILERVPEAALTFEMQGYMVDVIRARHPQTLARMKALTASGQLELASIHWSDQFFLAFGREDMDESWRRTQASFEAADLPISRVVFTQEGQFGEGFAAWLKETRPDAIMVMARNLQGFFQDDLVDRALWSVRGLDVVLPRGFADDQIDRRFSFFDDGELLATNDTNPYLGLAFAEHANSVRRYERRLRCEAEAGIRVARITDYVDAVSVEGQDPVEMPPFMDGTWQPRSTRGPLRWMGGAGGFSKHEQDNRVLTTCVKARRMVLALQTVADDPEIDLEESDLDALDRSWRALLFGQVSDARGVNPWYGEVLYGLENCTEAGELARAAIGAIAARMGAAMWRIDTDSGVIEPLDTIDEEVPREVVAAPFEVRIKEGAERGPRIEWSLIAGQPPGPDNPYRLSITWPADPQAQADYDACRIESEDWACATQPEPVAITLPRDAGFIGYRPALLGQIVRFAEEDFTLQQAAYDDAIWSVAADGLVDLGAPGFLVKDTRQVHLAIGWPPAEARRELVEIRDETLQRRFEATWVFHLTEDEATAERLADRNLRPIVIVPAN